MSNSMKICTVEADLFHAEGQTDGQTGTTKIIFAFRNFANAPKKAIMSLNAIKRLVSVLEEQSVYCEVRTKFLCYLCYIPLSKVYSRSSEVPSGVLGTTSYGKMKFGLDNADP